MAILICFRTPLCMQFSVMWNLEPDEDMFRGTTVMFLSLVMLFAVYIFAVILVGYAVIG